MSDGRTKALAWGLFGLFIAMLLADIVVIASGSGRFEDLFFAAVGSYALVGALVASRLPRNPIGWILLAIGNTLALGALADSNLLSASAVLPELSAWLSEWTWYVWLTLAGIFLPMLFPTGRLLSPRWRPVLWLAVAAVAASVTGAAFAPGEFDLDDDVPHSIENPLGLAGAAGALEAVALIGDVLAGVTFLLAAASLVIRFRSSRGVEHEQLKWFAYAALLAAAGLALAMAQVLFGLDEADGGRQEGGWLEAVGTVGWFTALGAIIIGIPTATGMAILRHRLYDIDVVIRRTLVYAGLTATLLASYLAGVLLLQLALSPLTEDNDLAIAGSTLAAAALFRPARARIQALVDRRFFRRKYDAGQTVASFGARLRDEVELDAVVGDLRSVVRDTMQPAHLSLWLRAPQ